MNIQQFQEMLAEWDRTPLENRQQWARLHASTFDQEAAELRKTLTAALCLKETAPDAEILATVADVVERNVNQAVTIIDLESQIKHRHTCASCKHWVNKRECAKLGEPDELRGHVYTAADFGCSLWEKKT